MDAAPQLTYEDACNELEIIKTSKENELLSDTKAKSVILRETTALQMGLDLLKEVNDREQLLHISYDYITAIDKLNLIVDKMEGDIRYSEEDISAVNAGIAALTKLCDLQIKLENHNKLKE